MFQGQGQIRYDVLIHKALRGLIRDVLTSVMNDGLPGTHYFHITFRTHFPGVHLSESLRTRFPHHMTIVLQHQFWGLKVTDQGIDVGLYFGGIPERLSIPFPAITDFRDDSVQFHLSFPVDENSEEFFSPECAEDVETSLPSSPPFSPPEGLPTTSTPSASGRPDDPEGSPIAESQDKQEKVVSIDAFRKKNL